MDWIELKGRLSGLVSKYKFVLLILCVGILLMTFPNPEKKEISAAAQPEPIAENDLSNELEEILAQIQGVGKVRVMLTESSGSETIYQMDEDRTQSDGSESIRLETVLVSSGNDDQGLVKTVTPPVYLGAIIVCQGGGDPAVRLAVVQAVSSVTGIGADRISVLKMK